MKSARTVLAISFFAVVLVSASAGCLFCGAVDIPAADVVGSLTGDSSVGDAWRYIVVETRLPGAVGAILCGAALSLAGLLMQTTFDNPLAGPSILGISTGSSLGVALMMLTVGGSSLPGQAATLGGALVGALAVILLLTAISSVVRSSTMLLIVGILLGYLASSAISLLNFFAPSERVHSYVIWGLGSFSGVSLDMLPLFAVGVVVPAVAAMFYIKPLNALLLGDRYAQSAGVSVKAVRTGLLVIAGALTAAATAWCGPIGFIGLVVPHLARLGLRTTNHRVLVPATFLAGGALGAMCQWICVAPGSLGLIPVNAVTPVIGVPVIIYIIVKRRSIFYFN